VPVFQVYMRSFALINWADRKPTLGPRQQSSGL